MISTGQTRSGNFTVTPRREGDVLVLYVSGDLDVLTAPTLSTHLDVALTDAPAVVIVDITAVTFLSSAGIGLLVETHRLTERGGISLRVVADGAATSRPLRMMRIDEVIDLYPTTAEARAGRRS
ncbi:STAS domain-containing protein [Mycolicibacterium vaccae]|jgi:anti-sigma B factor antagonist|uniref:Anti-sigma factor antagonist n=1 Tax=Mycolicibacterium vaccae ATCC 25954 TaxID=1194972 RepID=K0VA49_MYCVA|nr:STAS domain-containing protein [Mycolicibacterium vaccae]ANI38453.1 anti-sigma factor antagonist [Mycolicibacterium vaccae 95051]EJZ11763.1 anti-anti-sigma factor [Mycolicibacterium vaccae ATCC 25954]MCV7062147.1 STAS domain-containing protein [Mycolicibacterium vaccae]